MKIHVLVEGGQSTKMKLLFPELNNNNTIITIWKLDLERLTEFGQMEPQTAYTVFFMDCEENRHTRSEVMKPQKTSCSGWNIRSVTHSFLS